jgi:hypothetical protein
MKKQILTSALAVLVVASFNYPAWANQENEDYRGYNRHPNADQRQYNRGLDYQINHVNRMLAHVERLMRRHGAGPHIWREYRHVRFEVRQLNNQYHNSERYFDRRSLSAQIEHIHGELHHIERELNIRSGEWYRWR